MLILDQFVSNNLTLLCNHKALALMDFVINSKPKFLPGIMYIQVLQASQQKVLQNHEQLQD